MVSYAVGQCSVVLMSALSTLHIINDSFYLLLISVVRVIVNETAGQIKIILNEQEIILLFLISRI